jgi:hypothetical protein
MIEAVNQLERLETLAVQPDNSESEKKALRQAIAELKQLIHAHACRYFYPVRLNG